MSHALIKGPGEVLGPEEGESYWQGAPHFGHMTIKVSPESHPSKSFSFGTQVLPPGCHVREHGHARNDEILFVFEGVGEAVIDGEVHPLEPGSTVILGQYVAHILRNTGSTDMKFVWFFTPPGLETVIRATGAPRKPGEPRPAHIPRPDNMPEVLKSAGYATPEQIAASRRS
jgi:mannose-6-phosphate isomerase-like protein (cupin superfamily)